MSPEEEYFMGLLVMAIFWAFFSGGCVVASTQAGNAWRPGSGRPPSGRLPWSPPTASGSCCEGRAVRVEFPYRVSDLDSLPKPFAAEAPPTAEIIVIPPQGFGAWRDHGWMGRRGPAEPSRALAIGQDRLWVLEEREGEGVIRREAAIDELLEVEIGNVLLHAWVAFVPDGAEPIRLDFNLVALPIFEELLNRVMEKLRGDCPEASVGEPAGLAWFRRGARVARDN